MNNGNFGGYDPNRRNQNDSFGFMGGYDPNNPNNAGGYQNQNDTFNPYNNPYQSTNGYGSQNNSYGSTPQQNNSGYAPYHGGTYSNPTQNTAYPQQAQNSYYNQPVQSTSYNQTSDQGRQAGFMDHLVMGRSDSGAISMANYSKRVFLWMGAGLALTFFVALGLMLYLTSGGEWELYSRFQNFVPLFYGGLVFEVILALVLNIFVAKMPYGVSLAMFLVYSIVSGVTFTPILVVYDAGSAIFAFAAAAVLFIAFAIYGIVTKRDMMKLGPILMIGLIVLLLFSLIGIFVGMSTMSIIISIIGIIIFIGLTAYDAQKIRVSYEQLSGNPEMLKKMSVNMALQLYLDFVNLFIYILRLMGKARR